MGHQRAKIQRWKGFFCLFVCSLSLDYFRKGKERDEVVKDKKVIGEKTRYTFMRKSMIYLVL